MAFKRILCAVDFSESSTAALAVAAEFAQASGSLLLCHVVGRDSRPRAARLRNAGEAFEETRAGRERDLEQARRGVAAKVAAAEALVIVASSVWDALTSEAANWRADLVVIGGGERHNVMGSTSERVVRHAPCSVLAVARSGCALERVLCAVDFSGPSREAMTVAADVAGKHGARLTLLHVVSNQERALAAPAAVLGGALDACQHAAETLRGWAVELQPRARSVVAVAVAEGRTADAIVGAARNHNADLMVVGTHGRTGIQRALVGSVAEEVVRWAECTILVVR